LWIYAHTHTYSSKSAFPGVCFFGVQRPHFWSIFANQGSHLQILICKGKRERGREREGVCVCVCVVCVACVHEYCCVLRNLTHATNLHTHTYTPPCTAPCGHSATSAQACGSQARGAKRRDVGLSDRPCQPRQTAPQYTKIWGSI